MLDIFLDAEKLSQTNSNLEQEILKYKKTIDETFQRISKLNAEWDDQDYKDLIEQIRNLESGYYNELEPAYKKIASASESLISKKKGIK